MLEVRNPSRHKISYSLTIRDSGDFLPRQTLGYLPSLAAGKLKTFHYLTRVTRRGVYQFSDIHLATRFPFGLFVKSREIDLPEDAIVYPAIARVPFGMRTARSVTRPTSAATATPTSRTAATEGLQNRYRLFPCASWR